MSETDRSNGADRSEAMRDAAREALRELMPELLGEALRGAPSAPASANGHASAEPDLVPLVPAPPVAAVMRPSGWAEPAAPGEVIGADGPEPAVAPPPSGATAQPMAAHSPDARLEAVSIDDDEDLDAFVRALASRLENPRDRLAIRAGKLRFTLRRGSQPASTGGASGEGSLRIEKGAVTERAVSEAAARGVTLVLSRRAVLTPLARDKGRALGVRIEREG
jgi:hypothetical protein